MALNPQVEALLGLFSQFPPIDVATLTAQALRDSNNRPMPMGPPPAVAEARDLVIALPGRDLPARLYVPIGGGDGLPLVVYSGRDLSPTERRLLTLGPTHFLAKAKVQPQQLEALVLTMLRSSRQMEEAPTEAPASKP